MTRGRRLFRRFLPHALVLAGALALSAAAFWPGVRGQFVSDDINAIVENEWVAGPLDVGGIFSNFSWWGGGRADAPGYRPLVTLSFALNRQLTGVSPYGFHVVNMVVHAIVSWLLFVLARSLGIGSAAAALAAMASCLLPIHSEAVVWIVGRAELGAAAAFLGVAIMLLQYREHGRPMHLLGAGAALIAGMLCKENAVTVLAAPLIYTLTLRVQPHEAADPAARVRTALRRDLVAMPALLASFALYVAIRMSADGPALPRAEDSLLDNPLSVLPTLHRLLGAVSVLGRYLWLTLWPHPLSVDYSYDAAGIGQGFLFDRYTLVAMAVLGLCVATAWRLRSRVPALPAALLLAASAYSIVSNTIYPIGTIMGERLFYLPSALLCVAGAAVLDRPLRAALPASPRTRAGILSTLGRSPGLAAIPICALAIAATWMTIDARRARQWLTPIDLFRSAAAAVPRSARAHMELGSAYGHVGRIEDARRHFTEALTIYPGYTVAAYNYGNALVRAGRFGEAEAAYRRALDQDPKLGRAWNNIALVYRTLQRNEDSLQAFDRAVELSPAHPDLRVQHGEALLAAGRNQDAIQAYDAAIALGADSALVRFNRGVAKHRLHGCQSAMDDYRASASMPGAPVQATHAMVGCLRQLGRSDEADALLQSGKVANQGTRR